ncbi:MAG: ABC transporter ATP-binding protein [Myxococcota bacterium]
MSKESQPRSNADLKRLLGLVKPYKFTLAVGLLTLLIGTGMMLLYPYLVGTMVDQALNGRDMSRLNTGILVLMGTFLVQSVFTFGRYYLFTMVGERVVVDLRNALYQSLVSQEVAFFDEKRTGELVSRLASDTSVLQNTVTSNISMALRFGLQAIGGIAVLFWTSTELTLVMLSAVPVVVLAAVLYGRRIRKLSLEVQDALATSSEVAEETMSGIRTVRSFARERGEVARYAEAVEKSYKLALKRTSAAGWFGAVISFAGYAAMALVLWYGGRLVMSNEMTVGTLTSFVLYTLTVAVALGTLSSLHTDFMKAIGASERVFELLDRVPTVRAPESPVKPAVQTGQVELDAVTFSYPARSDREVLKQVSLRLEPGQMVALVGPSGSGKSTVAALLPRFYDPQQGTIRFDGEDIRTLDPQWLREQIGMVAQEPVLFATSIEENIRYGRPDATLAEVEAAARAANAHDFICSFPEGYKTLVGERGVRLSGGQKQRIAIARAVLKNPLLLILDEATSALDSESEHLVQEALDRLMHGRTTLVIAHRLSTVRDADCVVVLENGKVIQQGDHDTLMKSDGLYRKLVERQFALHDAA